MRRSQSATGRRTGFLALTAVITLAGSVLVGVPAYAVTTGNGSLVYAPPDGSSFNDEGGDATGTAYAKIVALKHSGAANGTLIVTFDDGRLIGAHQRALPAVGTREGGHPVGPAVERGGACDASRPAPACRGPGGRGPGSHSRRGLRRGRTRGR